jgi:RNA polymerase sigma-70 factor (ECF subfamily)
MAKNSICNYYDHLIVTEKFVAQEMLRPSSVENTEEIIFANQLQAMIDVAVNEMPPQRKQIYLMSRVDGLNNAEIAEKIEYQQTHRRKPSYCSFSRFAKGGEVVRYAF